MLHVVLFVTVLASSVAFIEPSPHDILMGVLAIVCVIAGVRFDRKLVPLLVLLVLFNAGLVASLLNVLDDEKAVMYAGISLYLAIATLIFACLFSEDSMRRLATMRTAYILSAVVATGFAMIGYFNLFHGAEELFAKIGRANSTFKDPNVFGPFLILPLLFLLDDMIARKVRLVGVLVTCWLLFGLLLSFSRGAWMHFVLSSAVLLALLFFTGPTLRARSRVVFAGLVAIGAIAVLVIMLMSIDSVYQMFVERAKAIQYYDVGPMGRFHLQKLALHALLDYPNGMGPFGFQEMQGQQQHNVYLQAFLVYGWVGGVTYVALVLLTLVVGIRGAFTATPWQPYLICAVAAFVGEFGEGFVVDTDHWRHFFLLLGMIWGLSIANLNVQRAAAIGRNQAAAA